LSKTIINVNEEYEVTGKLHIMNAWPAAIQVPDQAFLNTGQPGAMAARLGVWVGNTFTPRSMKLELGKTYDFRVLLKARRPGHWHTHVQLSVKTGGPIPGPGQYIDITDNLADYTDDVKLLNGSTVDLETYGLGKVSLWHLLFWATALATWLWYLFRERRLLGRLVAVAIRRDEEPITRKEWLVGAVTLGAVLGAVIIFAILSAYSNIIPLQGDNISEIKLNAEEPAPINVEYLGATYKVLDHELRANLKITNEAKEPLQISEFASGGLRFISKENYPEYLLAARTLSLNDYNPLQHGETRNIVLTAQDAKWDTESLLGLDLSNNIDRSFAGLLFLNSPSGKRYPIEVGGPVTLNFH
jgi:methane/ammonia monooxygenase subunit B